MYTKHVLLAALAATLLTALPALSALPAVAAPTGGPVRAPAAGPTAAGAVSGTRLGPCGPGQLCLWPKADFRGSVWTYELAGTDIESCVALPPGASAQALANRTGRPVTTYQSAECAETGEFETYPGRGTWVPQTPYQVRAFKLWER
ncbi:peptidase inhibitor family I36 protein [Streptomyces sp. Je 1-79]|uniref:peptidase inhibitor family I36 protein n=1 Tax=Streptomyces sp. Je 1-79 TaxID=2943847 RepID=UPI0021A4C9FA|nr:peptidase inhibitor family I36 protein [Streptomyces sp. Je 1-79]MCT4352875.1 peptidase inhibitor family I36 protein [Streptomyces sp. Je 1-79]